MKTKIAIFLILFFLFSSASVYAGQPGEPGPEAYLTIVMENPQETYARFDLNMEIDSIWEYFTDIGLYTEPDYPSAY